MSPARGTRRLIRGILGTVAILLVAVPTADAAGPSSFSAQLTETVAAFPGTASVVVVDPRSGFRFMWEADTIRPAASLHKLGVMAEAYRRAAIGAISLDATTIEVTDEDVLDDGYYTDPGTVLTVREAIERMITLSDNTPARALLRLLERRKVNALFKALGMSRTRINYGLPPEEQTASYNLTTARDIERFFMGLLRGTVVGRAQSAEMIGVLSRQRINDRLPAGLPEGAVIAHKTGDLGGVSHDAGIIFTADGPRIAVVMTADYGPFDDVVTLNEKVAALAYSAQLDAFAARYTVLARPAEPLHPGKFAWTVEVRNAGADTWDQTNHLRATLWSTASSGERLAPIDLPPLAPGAAAALTVSVQVTSPGVYLLELEVYDDDDGGTGNKLPIVFEVR